MKTFIVVPVSGDAVCEIQAEKIGQAGPDVVTLIAGNAIVAVVALKNVIAIHQENEPEINTVRSI